MEGGDEKQASKEWHNETAEVSNVAIAKPFDN